MSTLTNKNCSPRSAWAGQALGLLLLVLIGFAIAVEPAVAPPPPGAAAERLLATCLPRYPEAACRCVARAMPSPRRRRRLRCGGRVSRLVKLARARADAICSVSTRGYLSELKVMDRSGR